jgi:hypothetical protein
MTRLLWAVAVVWGLALTHSPRASQIVEQAAAPHAAIEFQTSDNCLACHNGLTTPAGEDVSIGVQWRSSMMANSARDPYWQASVRRETIDHPLKKEAIEDECAICHMPMARTAARASGRPGEVFRLLPATPSGDEEHRLAADGVACSLCHQIGPDRLGTRESFVGGFVINQAGAGRRMFGPFDVDKGLTAVMRSATDAQPARADHVRSSELCATCHTLYTEAFDETGKVIGSLPEQVPYLEWQHSAFRAEQRSCQACHMPRVRSTAFSSVLGEPREEWGRHAFLGGNFFMLRMLNRYRTELRVSAPPAELDRAAHATIQQLQTETATVSISRAEVRSGLLEIDVVVRNQTGHKLPTGYPSRRVWLHLTLRDARGATVFESGGTTDMGLIRGNDNDADPRRYEPHYQDIRQPDQVQIYESIMGDVRRTVTTGLLQATQFLKDNRLLPRGFDKAKAEPDIAVIGEARDDADFSDSGDTVRYVVDPNGAAGPFEVDVELRFQPISFRWADNLRRYDASEPRRFLTFFDAMAASSSVSLARTATTLR